MAVWKRVCVFFPGHSAPCLSAILDDTLTLWDIVYGICLFWSTGWRFSTKLYGTMVFSLLLARVFNHVFHWCINEDITLLHRCNFIASGCDLHCSSRLPAPHGFLVTAYTTQWWLVPVFISCGCRWFSTQMPSFFFVSGCVECKHNSGENLHPAALFFLFSACYVPNILWWW